MDMNVNIRGWRLMLEMIEMYRLVTVNHCFVWLSSISILGSFQQQSRKRLSEV
jgi:hypothetical protein